MRCTETNPYMIDVVRPSIVTEESRTFWRRFFDLVETIDMPIAANNAYDWVREIAFSDHDQYMGGGYSFCFWFATKEDRKRFLKQADEKIGMMYEDWRHVRMYNSMADKTLRLSFHKKLHERVKSIPDITIETTDGEFYFADGKVPDLLKLKKTLNEHLLDLD